MDGPYPTASVLAKCDDLPPPVLCPATGTRRVVRIVDRQWFERKRLGTSHILRLRLFVKSICAMKIAVGSHYIYPRPPTLHKQDQTKSRLTNI